MRDRNTELLQIKRGDNFRTLKLIDKVAHFEQNHDFIRRSIEMLGLTGDRDSLKRVFDCVYNLCKFFPDPEETQYIRTVNRQLKDRRANCVDYTVFLSAFLRALKVPHSIRMTQTDEDFPGYNHIYIVLQDGTALDPVINQSQDGTEPFKTRRAPAAFGQEVPYIKKFDKKIRVR